MKHVSNIPLIEKLVADDHEMSHLGTLHNTVVSHHRLLALSAGASSHIKTKNILAGITKTNFKTS